MTESVLEKFAKNFQTLELDGEAYKGKFELNNWKSIEKYLKENVRTMDLRNKDTNEPIKIGAKGIDKLLHRAATNGKAYKKTLAHLPEIITNMIYIASEKNKKGDGKGYDEYKRYLTEIRMEGKTYIVLSIVGKNEEAFYYDQQLFPGSKNEFMEKHKDRLADVGQLGWAESEAICPAGTESEPTY
jgi:hypothetical protein